MRGKWEAVPGSRHQAAAAPTVGPMTHSREQTTKIRKSAGEGTVDVHLGGDGDFYVYALSRVPVTAGRFNPDNIFYVGKGKGLRWQAHFAEAREAMAQKDADPEIELSAKHQEISRIIGDVGDDLVLEDYAYIVRGNLTEDEAFLIEALIIKLLNRPGAELTNKVAGQHAERALIPATEVRRFYSAEELEVDRVRAAELKGFIPGGEWDQHGVCIIVKGSTADMEEYEDIDFDAEPRFPGAAVDVGERRGVRRGWSPDWPWEDADARERARHYWQLSVDTVKALQAIAADGRLQLAMLIKDSRAGQSAVRFVWEVDARGTWLDYGRKVGIPLGAELPDDAWLGASLVRQEDGKQILEGMPNGVTFAAF